MMYGWGNIVSVGGFMMMFMMVLFWGLIIAGIVFAVRALTGGSIAGPAQESKNRALDILQERYARGEISTEEYEEHKRQLAS